MTLGVGVRVRHKADFVRRGRSFLTPRLGAALTRKPRAAAPAVADSLWSEDGSAARPLVSSGGTVRERDFLTSLRSQFRMF